MKSLFILFIGAGSEKRTTRVVVDERGRGYHESHFCVGNTLPPRKKYSRAELSEEKYFNENKLSIQEQVLASRYASPFLYCFVVVVLVF